MIMVKVEIISINYNLIMYCPWLNIDEVDDNIR